MTEPDPQKLPRKNIEAGQYQLSANMRCLTLAAKLNGALGISNFTSVSATRWLTAILALANIQITGIEYGN